MRAELKKLQTSLGITFVHVTHSQEEAMALADIIVVMNDGRIEQAASPRTVFERPATAFVARFMGDHNVISGRTVETDVGGITIEVNGGGRFQAIDGKGVIGEPADIAVRTDRVRLRETAYAGLGFTGIVQNVEYRGSSVKIVVNGTGGTDHGTGTLAMLAGGAIAGGRIAGDWPGLSPAQLNEGRDLRATTDLRSVFKGVVGDHLGIARATLDGRVFPDSGGTAAMKGLLRG